MSPVIFIQFLKELQKLKKTEEINELLDFYENLLTSRQIEIMTMYYRDDFSLAEIAEDMGTSRSAVYDLIKRCEKTLTQYENKLMLIKKYHQRNKIYQKIMEKNDPIINQLIKECMDTE